MARDIQATACAFRFLRQPSFFFICTGAFCRTSSSPLDPSRKKGLAELAAAPSLLDLTAKVRQILEMPVHDQSQAREGPRPFETSAKENPVPVPVERKQETCCLQLLWRG